MYEGTCGGDGTATACYIDNVIGNGTNYANAYFEIAYIKAFSNSSALVATTSGGSTVLVSATATSSSGSSSSSSGSQSNTRLPEVGARAFVAVAGATVLAAFSWVLL